MVVAGVVGGAHRRIVGLAVVLLAVLGLGVGSQGAWAGKGVVGVFGGSGSGDGQFANAAATAVNLSTGDVYVVDQFGYRVEQFDASGAFLRAFGWGVADGSAAAQTCTSSCQPGIPGNGDGQFDTPQGIAVDQSTGALYVVDGNNSRVEKFDASGVYQSQFGSAGSGDGQFSGPQGIGVASDGSVFVADTGNHRVEKFDNTGAYVSQFGSEGSGDGQFEGPTRVAVDSSGQTYVLDSGNGRIERFTSAGVFDVVVDPGDVFLPQELAISPVSGNLWVAQWAVDFSEHHVIEIDAGSSALVDTHGVGSGANNSSGLALSASEKVYWADGFNARVFILDDVTAPDVTIDPATGVTSTTASLSGTVNPNGNPNMSWHFEISTDDANWSPAAADQDPGSGNTPVPVSQDLTGLVPNTTYFVRLVAQRAFNARAISPEIQFTTTAIPPDVTTGVADDVTPDHAVLQGLINPHNNPTTYYFQYGTTTAYGTSIPATQDADAGSANQVGEVLQRINNLQPGTTYHYRLVATNSADTTDGQDQTFTTTTPPAPSTPRPRIPGAGFLPDNRGWEKVSPNDKNGGDITPDAGRTSIATDGNASTLSSLTAFGDALGTGVATDYMSLRSNSGWTTHAITPPQAPTTVNAVVVNLQSVYLAFSSDLSRGVFMGWSPVTDDPNVAGVANLYLREDAKTAGAGLYQLTSPCPLCAATNTPLPPLLGGITGGGQPRFAGASADFEHVLFESQLPLTSDAPSGCTDLRDLNQCPPNLYEWDHGTLRLVGLLPNSACGSPPCPSHGSLAGQGAGAAQTNAKLTPHVISVDGSRITFVAPDTGGLYMRINHSVTVQLNSSERTDCAGDPTCGGDAVPDPAPDPNGSQLATYQDASVDGSRVFFSTTEALTDDAPTGSNKLYVYDASKPDTDPHNITFISVDNQPADAGDLVNVQGVSSNGHYIYFAAFGRLLADQPFVDRALYVWHDGTIKLIASMELFPDDGEDSNSSSWVLNPPTARVTPDGLHLLFSSTLAIGPTGYDQGHCQTNGPGCREFYLYDYNSQRLACVSCNPSGAAATKPAFAQARFNNGASVTAPPQNHPLSDDGRHVFFSTAEALVPGDGNGKVDVYEYDAPTGTVHLITNGTERSDSYFLNASPSGNDALFVTRGRLVGADVDNNYDLYDARVGGGFSEPLPPPQACTGDACQAPQSQVIETAGPGTNLVTGRSGSKARKSKPKRCHKGYVRKKLRGKSTCVKKRRASKGKPQHKTKKMKRSRSRRRAK